VCELQPVFDLLHVRHELFLLHDHRLERLPDRIGALRVVVLLDQQL
jgi:hypothetical protein